MNTRRRLNRFGPGLLAIAAMGTIGLGLPAAASAQPARPAPAVSSDLPLVPVVGAAKVDLLRALAAKSGDDSYGPMHHECPGGNPHVQGIACGSTTTEQLVSTDCVLPEDQSLLDFYAFEGTVGQTVTITMTSTAFDTYLFLIIPAGTDDVAQDNNSGGGTNARIVFTLTETGTWFIAANSATGGQSGAYTLILECTGGGGGGACTPNSTTLCLNNGRFRVQANWAAPDGTSGAGTAVPETSDTGLFWFFSANNIEMIIKVVNACTFPGAPRYWVFAGGLTNVQVTITVTDTANGTTRTYTNPQGTAFAPIQDTNAFATCP